MKVLIAEDDLVSRKLLEAVLKKWGYEVISTTDGDQAWKILQTPESPQLAILDWMMPGLDGIEICRKMRTEKISEELYHYLILLTSKTSKEDIVAGIEAGADDYIVKPFHKQELHVRMRAGQRIIELQSELIAAKETLKEQATHDALTGILNRRAIMDRLDKDLAHAVRLGKPLGLGMVDLDHFKKVNDTYGHQSGDIVLKEFVKRAQSMIRKYDTIGRYGGEEFLVITPDVDIETSKTIFERIRNSIAEQKVQLEKQKIPVTASLGVAISEKNSTADVLMKAADTALYKAKETGRNRVEYAQ